MIGIGVGSVVFGLEHLQNVRPVAHQEASQFAYFLKRLEELEKRVAELEGANADNTDT